MKHWIRKRISNKWLICKKNGQKKPKLETLKSSTHLNMQQRIEEHDGVLNANKDNGTTETI